MIFNILHFHSILSILFILNGFETCGSFHSVGRHLTPTNLILIIWTFLSTSISAIISPQRNLGLIPQNFLHRFLIIQPPITNPENSAFERGGCSVSVGKFFLDTFDSFKMRSLNCPEICFQYILHRMPELTTVTIFIST